MDNSEEDSMDQAKISYVGIQLAWAGARDASTSLTTTPGKPICKGVREVCMKAKYNAFIYLYLRMLVHAKPPLRILS